jgi:hypothetical protein
MGANLKSMYVASSAQLGASYALVSIQTFASNAVTFSGLSGDYRYKVYAKMAFVDTTETMVEINADTTAADYTGQTLTGNGAVVSSERLATNRMVYCDAGDTYLVLDVDKDSTGYVHMIGAYSPMAAGAVAYTSRSVKKATGVVTEITSIKLLKSATGTSITGQALLYKLSKV